jgi:hypothetical protein
MNKAQLKRHTEALLEAYEALNLVWADIGVIKVALEADKLPAVWMVRDMLQRDWEVIGDSLLAITEFTDAMIEEESK